MSRRERAGSVCIHDGRALLVRLRDPKTQVVRLFPPGGGIEKGETPEQTAVRETLEETGYQVSLLDRVEVAYYPFEWEGRVYDCTTHLYLSQWDGSPPISGERDSVHLGIEWVGLPEVPNVLGYDRFILEAVMKLIRDEASKAVEK